MRVAAIGLLISLSFAYAGCVGGSIGRAKQVPGGVPLGPPASLQGTIGGRPFAARSAVMLPPERWNNGITVQKLLVFERPMGCGEADDIDRLRASLVPGEHVVEVTFPAPWPHYPGTVWPAGSGSSPYEGHNEIGVGFAQRGSNGAPETTFARGDARVHAASPGGGVIALRASVDPNDPRFRSTTPEALRGKLWGDVSGDVPFIVCRR